MSDTSRPPAAPDPSGSDSPGEAPQQVLLTRLRQQGLGWFVRQVERWLPPGFAQLDREQQRQARTLVAFALVVLPSALQPLYMVLFKEAKLLGMIGLAPVLVVALVPPMVRRTGRVALATHMAISAMFLTFVVLMWVTGGLTQGSWKFANFLLPPLAATLVTGRGGGLCWMALCTLAVLAFGAAGPLEVVLQVAPTPAQELPIRTLGLSILVVATSLFALQFDKIKNALFSELQREHRVLEEEKKESERQRQAAEQARNRAEIEHGEALQAQGEAERARAEADRAREAAEVQRARAEREHALAEQALGEAEQARAMAEEADRHKTRFFQNMSHELRTPLTLILAPLKRALEQEPANDHMAVAHRNAQRLLRLVNQLLDFQKLRAGKLDLRLAPLDLVEFCRVTTACFAPACEDRGVTLTRTVEGTPLSAETAPLFVRGEVDALEKMLFNYLSNALKYAPRDGHIGVDLRVAQGRVRLSVQDDGPGIARADQDMLFQVFSQVDGSATRAHEGTGLGLALVKQLAEAMDGEVGLQSAPGEGARFWIELTEVSPAQAPEGAQTGLENFQARAWLLADGEDQHRSIPPPRSLPPKPVVPGVTGAHILVVDDLADMRDLLAGTLVAQGYRVQVADRAEVALKAARRSVPDLIVSDWMMPGQTGPQMVEELRQDARLEHVPVILLTARSGAESKLEATLCGADAFLGKPFDEAELLAQVHNLLRLKAREHEVTALNQRLVEQVLTRCLPPALLEGVLSGETSFSQSPELRQVTVLSARLEGFELQLRSLPAERSGTMLNDYLDLVSRMAFDHQGTLAHFAADRINVLFGAPEPLPEDAALRAALRCAADMQERIGSLAEGWVHGGLGRATLCIGVHSGEALVGTFGSELRAEYTAIGPAVAMAEKLAQVASPGSVTMTSDSADGLPSGISSKAGQLVLQGEADPIPLACLSAGAAGLLAEASRRTGSD